MLKKIVINIFLLLFFFLLVCYVFCIFGLPKLLNSRLFLQKIEKILYEKTDTNISVTNSNIKISPLFVIDWYIQNANVDKHNKNIIKFENININADVKKFCLQRIVAENIFINTDYIKFLKKHEKPRKHFDFDFSKIPEISIKELTLFSDSEIKYEAVLKNLDIFENSINFDSILNSSGLETPINLSVNGKILKGNNFLGVENLKIFSKNGLIVVNGKLFCKRGVDFSVKSEKIPVDKTMKLILYLQKLTDPTKKFIENFTNYGGELSLDLRFKKDKVSGKIVAENLRANTVLFNVPINFKKAEFFAKDQELNSIAYGTFGTEKVTHKLKITNILSPHREVFGEVTAPFTDRLVRKYVPDSKMKNSADVNVSYYFKDKKIDVKYNLDLKKGTDIFYKNIYLGLEDKHRRFFARTFKDGNNIFLKEYNYSLIEDGNIKNIIFGDGLFTRINGTYKPQFVTYKTNGFAPTSVVGSFNRYVYGGEFKGELKYDFNKKSLVGDFEVIDTIFNKFYVEKAVINADENELKAHAQGKYRGQDFSSDLTAKNCFDNKIIVKNMDLFLDKYIVIRNHTKKHKAPPTDISKKVRAINMSVDKMSIKLNTLTIDKLVLRNINLFGNLKNNILNFSMSELDYAKGIIKANGLFNFNKDCLCVNFSAQNIDANSIATTLFDLPNQVVGIANADLKIETIKRFHDINAHANFEIDNGFLPKIGNTEFILFHSKKVKLEDIVNVDLTRRNSFQANIKGSFDFNKTKIKNLNLTSSQQYLALFIEGNHNIKNSYTDINIYGKYNKTTPKGVKVIHIPLNLLLKVILKMEDTKAYYQPELDKIPPIDAAKEDEQYFRVKLKGNIKSDNVDVELKRIK